MEQVRKAMDQAVEEMLPVMIEYAKRIVSFETTVGNEAAAQAYVSEVLRKNGFEVDMWTPDAAAMQQKYTFFKGSRETFEGSPNVVGVWKGSGTGRSLMVNGHIDVVPAGELRDWTVDPFEGVVRNNQIVGRGISDMKCTHAVFFFCVEVLKKLGLRLKGDLLFASVIDEETGGAGSLAVAMRGYHADAAILPEPTDMVMCPATQGVSYFKIYVKGKAAHGGTRYEGVNAIEKAIKVVEAVRQLEAERTKKLSHALYQNKQIPFTINIGTIHGGAWPSMVADEVVLEGRYGVAPQETLAEARGDMERCLKDLAKEDHWFAQAPARVEWTSNVLQSGEIPVDHEFVKTVRSAYEAVLEEAPQIKGTPFGTDAGTLIRFANTPALVFGPGKCAHCADEYLDIDVMKQYAKILLTTMVDWCGVEEE